MTKIYDQHRAAFANVSAYVVLKDGERVATVAFKYPRDGAGRLYCYFHILGTEMVRAYAGGGGYDKHSAAAHSAVSRIVIQETQQHAAVTVAKIKGVIQDRGQHWDSDLREAGFTVLQAV